MNSAPLRYRLIITLLSPVLCLYSLWQAWQCRNKRFALQRLGFAYPSMPAKPLWIHCASVGEVHAAAPLIRHLSSKPDLRPLLVSTATPTGADTVLKQNWQHVEHVFMPIDTQGAVKRAFVSLHPSALILLETEIWPNLINYASQSKTPVIIVNGRLSARTLNTPRWIQPIYKQALSKISKILSKSDEDSKKFEQLGALRAQIDTVGNLKQAALSTTPLPTGSLVNRPYWLAISTHENEELQLCQALLQQPTDGHLLVIAPRHPKRSLRIQSQLLSIGIKLAVRSKEEPIDSSTQVYLADTLGEIPQWLQHASVAFMGGSLVPVGGHNVLEPAAAGVPQVCGPHMDNFPAETRLLLEAKALQIADSAEQALLHIKSLLEDESVRVQKAEFAKQVVTQQSNVLERYVVALGPYISLQK